jgi:hypothetical protein
VKFAELQPFASATTIEGLPGFELNFQCPGCRTRTAIHVWERPSRSAGGWNVWQIKPRMPEAGLDHEPEWNNATIEPSMQGLPHPRQVQCTAHFSVIAGEIVHH